MKDSYNKKTKEKENNRLSDALLKGLSDPLLDLRTTRTSKTEEEGSSFRERETWNLRERVTEP